MDDPLMRANNEAYNFTYSFLLVVRLSIHVLCIIQCILFAEFSLSFLDSRKNSRFTRSSANVLPQVRPEVRLPPAGDVIAERLSWLPDGAP